MTIADLDAERALLSGLLLDARKLDDCLEHDLRASDFADPRHLSLYDSVCRLVDAGQPVTTITISNDLRRAGLLEDVGVGYLAQVEAAVPSSAHVGSYARLVRDAAQLRELAEAARQTLSDCELRMGRPEDILEDAERRVLAVARADASKMRDMKTLVKEATTQLEAAHKRRSPVLGVSTGLEPVDQLTAGWSAGDLIIIAGRPSMGKTAFALQACAHAAMNGTPAAVFSLEMGADQLTQRLLASGAKVDVQALRRGFVRSGDWVRLAQSASDLADAPLFIDDEPAISVGKMRARLRRLKAKHGVGLAMVDYLQLMSGPPELRSNPVATVTAISKGLKSIARELEMPVIALSQLSRKVEDRKDKRPLMSDLRESGAIEQDADLIGFLYREEYYAKEKTPEDKLGVAEFIVAKHRNGPTGAVDLSFHAPTTRFDMPRGRVVEYA